MCDGYGNLIDWNGLLVRTLCSGVTACRHVLEHLAFARGGLEEIGSARSNSIISSARNNSIIGSASGLPVGIDPNECDWTSTATHHSLVTILFADIVGEPGNLADATHIDMSSVQCRHICNMDVSCPSMLPSNPRKQVIDFNLSVITCTCHSVLQCSLW